MFDLPRLQATHRIFPRGIIHVGAHYGQEAAVYDELFRAERVLWIEGDPETHRTLCTQLLQYPRQTALNGLIGKTNGECRTFFRTANEGMSSSYLPLKRHLEFYPDIIVTGTTSLSTVTLPTLLALHQVDPAAYDYLVIDTQGTELDVLTGAKELLHAFQWICCEVNAIELYEGCAHFDEIARFLNDNGFVLAETAWTNSGWGEALFVSKEAVTAKTTADSIVPAT